MASPKRKKQEVLPRRVSAFYDAAVRRHNSAAGRIIWHWNRLHSKFTEAFINIVTPDDKQLGLAVWHAILADSGQRAMLQSVLEYKTTVPPRASEALEWMLAVVERLAQHRNDLVHTPMSQSISEIAPEFIVVPKPLMSKPQSAKRLIIPKRKKFHALLQGDLIQLYHYGEHAVWEFDYIGHKAWPKLPCVRSLPPDEVPLTRSQKNHQQMMQQHRAQQKASRGKRPKQSTRQRRDALIQEAKAKLANRK